METGEETERILRALAGLEGAACVCRGWPKQAAALPCLAVELAGEKSAGRWDDQEYMTEVEYYVRMFARTAAELDSLAAGVRSSMEALGYRRVFAWEESSAQIHQRTERYQAVIG